MPSNFDAILSNSGSVKKQTPTESKQFIPPDPEPVISDSSESMSPFAGLEEPQPEPTIRLNVDITRELNDKMARVARRYGIPKTELVRRLLEWGMAQGEG